MNEKQLLQTIFQQYQLSDTTKAELLRDLWNHVYYLETADQRYSLRICPSNIHKQMTIDELIWLEFAADQQLVQVPRPIRNRQGELVTTIQTHDGERICCLFEWIDGRPIESNLSLELMAPIGRAVAQLHQIGRAFGSPNEPRHKEFRANYRYNSGLVAEHREWIEERQQEIGEERVARLNKTVDLLTKELIRVGESGPNYGFIHADLHFGNFLTDGQAVHVIDFDQLAHGHYLYDLAVLWIELSNELDDITPFWEQFTIGYRQVAELPYKEESELRPFMVAVHLAFLDWVYNAPNPDVKIQMGAKIPVAYQAIQEWLRAT